MSCLLRLRLLRYRQTPMFPKRVKAHAIKREPSTLLLKHFFNFGEFQKARFCGRFNVYFFFFFFLCYHKRFVCRVTHYLYPQTARDQETLSVLRPTAVGIQHSSPHQSGYRLKLYMWRWQQKHNQQTCCHQDRR